MSETVETSCCGSLSAPVWVDYEPIGVKFYQHVYSMVHGLSLQDQQAADEGTIDDEESSDSEEDEGINPLLLDPIQWKDQDHYAILGLGKIRYRASSKEIRKAYQQKVLQHHPDKQASKEDTIFKCIQAAYEVLGNEKRRRAYDSVDPTFDDQVPLVCAHSKENFFEVFGPVFEENARWSVNKRVPLLGDPEDSIEHVEEIYRFWYEFNSWREFSYLDEENPDKAECRDERRWIQKQNKAARQKRKKEEMARIRALVDNAYACDPRVRRYKEKEKEEKLAQKRAKEEAARLEALRREEERRLEQEKERMAQEKKEREAAQLRQEKETRKKQLKKERRQLRAVCKEKGYFASSEADRVTAMQHMEHLCEALPADRLQDLHMRLARLSMEEGREVFGDEVSQLLQREREEELERIQTARAKAMSEPTSSKEEQWSVEETQLLIKAITLYPAGTVRRWEVVATFINTHSSKDCPEKTSQQVISKVKMLKKLDSGQKEAVNKRAFTRFEEKHLKAAKVDAPPTERDVGEVARPWSNEEQKQLEQALRTYPANTPQRWDKIAEQVSSRNKEECMARFKFLVARVKAKKQQT